ncbi:hypothetical protein T439DRAFT_380336 [Meredithblackwellia eburnea MCA 4105]
MTTTSDSIRQIHNHPPPNAVTAPTRIDEKNADIDRKVKLFGVVSAFREGKYPSNAQIDKTLSYILANPPVDTDKLSKDGQALISDFQEIIKTAQKIVQVKNQDELAQSFLYHSRHIDTNHVNFKENVNTSVTKDDLKSDGDQAVEHLRTLGKLIFTNSEARKLLKDVGILGRDIAADGAAKISDVARPADQDLAKVDEPAPSNQWVGPNGEIHGHHDPAPDTGLAAKRDAAKAKAEEKANEAKAEVDESANRIATAGDEAQARQGEFATDEQKANAAADAAGDVAQKEKKKKLEQLKAKIPEEHKERAKEQLQKAKEYAKDKFPQERRDRFIYRLKKVVVENQRHRNYQEAVEFFLDRAEHYHGHAKDIGSQGGSEGLNIRKDTSYQQAEFELQTLLERFANGQSMQPIFDAVDQLYTDAKNDQELTHWFKQLDVYVRRCLQEAGYIMTDQADRDGRVLLDSGKRFWDPKTGKYAGHKDALFDSVGTFFKAYADDELNVKLGEDVKKFTKALLMDSDGNLKYKADLWSDVRTVILPTIIRHAGYIPIPRIEYTDNQVDVVIENLTLESQNLLPNVFELEARNYFKVSPYKSIPDEGKHTFILSFAQVQADIKDVAFYINKKQGFPKLKDSGLADVFIGGKGISGKIHLASTGRKDHAFRVMDVKIKIDKLKFAVRDAKYSFLISTFKPIITGLVKKAVCRAIADGIEGGLVQLDAQLADISERMEDAKNQEDGVSTLDALKTSYKEKREEAKEAKEAVEPKGQFQITSDRDAKLVDWTSKNSMVDKIGDRKDAVHASADSHDWHSPAFDIVGGKTAAPKSYGLSPPSSRATSTTQGHGGAGVNGIGAGVASGAAVSAPLSSHEASAPVTSHSAVKEPLGATSPTTLPPPVEAITTYPTTSAPTVSAATSEIPSQPPQIAKPEMPAPLTLNQPAI